MFTSIEKLEIHAAKRYLEYIENDDFRAFRDPANPESFESNYAVLKRCDEASEAIRAVEEYYAGMPGVQPKFRWAPDAAPFAKAGTIFVRHGYEVVRIRRAFMQQTAQPDGNIRRAACTVRCAERLGKAECALIGLSYDRGPWGLGLITKQVAAGARAYFAYNHAGVPVSMAVGEGYGAAFYISDVFTPVPCRRQGCASSVLWKLLADARDAGYTDICLLTDEDGEARKLYERFGFHAEPQVRYWAVKGSAPQWLKEEANV